MPGSQTPRGRACACDDAQDRVAFHLADGVGALDNHISWLNGWPIRTPVNASRRTSRCATHDSGTTRFARSLLSGTFTLYSFPVSRRTSR